MFCFFRGKETSFEKFPPPVPHPSRTSNWGVFIIFTSSLGVCEANISNQRYIELLLASIELASNSNQTTVEQPKPFWGKFLVDLLNIYAIGDISLNFNITMSDIGLSALPTLFSKKVAKNS